MKRGLSRESFYKLVYLVLALALGFFVIRSFAGSLFITRGDRINFVIYDENPALYSISQAGGVNYAINFLPDLKIEVPGGYKNYRLGALGKLVELTGRPDIVRRTMSGAVSTFVNFYFHPSGARIYYGARRPAGFFIFPSFYKVFVYSSNAGFFDRLYLFLQLVNINKNNFTVIDDYPTEKISGERLYDEGKFMKRYQGYFYQKTYRTENKTVQIIYSKNFKSAAAISRVLDGTGIRVADLTIDENMKEAEQCLVIEAKNSHSRTARDIAHFFKCRKEENRTGPYDIILKLGKVEGEWEVN